MKKSYGKKSVGPIVLGTVNAPYGPLIKTPEQLAAKLIDPESVTNHDCSVFAFLIDVWPHVQKEFIDEMGIDEGKVAKVADGFSALTGYPLALCSK